jgi:hypothetical protein
MKARPSKDGEPAEAPAENDVTDPPRAVTRPTVDDMGEWSFPASDPPATWTWEVEVKRSP